jgi:photosystem II stability/assembly factor-like uncharacterized protein
MKHHKTLAMLLAGTLPAMSGHYLAAAAAPAATPFAGMQYRLIGPFRGGRVSAVAGVVQKPDVFYQGASGGGVWRTEDGGNTWKPLWDKLADASPSIGAVAVAPSDPKVIYVGTGEANIRGNVITGNGVYKSVDEGKTWSFAGLRDSQSIGRMVVHPTDPNTVFVAALCHPCGDNQERGVFRTRDGGKTWKRVLFVDARTGAIDVQMDPSDPNTLWAGMWQAHRKPWIMESGGPGSGLYRSRDGGETWQKQTGNGLPAGMLGRIGVAPTTNPKRIYTLIEAAEGGLFRTDDGGANWQRISDRGDFRQRAWYYTHVIADPKDPDKVFVLNTSAYKSMDAGKTFKTMPTFHGDNHSLWINPTNTDRMVEGNDGGANVSVNGSTISRSTSRCRTASTARSRTTAPCRLPAAMCVGQSGRKASGPQGVARAATSSRIPRIRMSPSRTAMATRLRATITRPGNYMQSVLSPVRQWAGQQRICNIVRSGRSPCCIHRTIRTCFTTPLKCCGARKMKAKPGSRFRPI